MTVDRCPDDPRRCPDYTHTWVDEEYDEDDHTVILTRRCSSCDVEEEVQLTPDGTTFREELEHWEQKASDSEEINWVAFDAVETDGVFAIVRIAVYKEGQGNPEYHGEYVFEA